MTQSTGPGGREPSLRQFVDALLEELRAHYLYATGDDNALRDVADCVRRAMFEAEDKAAEERRTLRTHSLKGSCHE